MRKGKFWLAIASAAILLANPVMTVCADETVETEAEPLEAEGQRAVISNATAGPEDPDETGNVKLTYKYNGNPVDGAAITAVRVAAINVDLGRYYPLDKFAEKYGKEIVLEDKTAAELNKMAKEIVDCGYFNESGWDAQNGKTDANGEIRFTGLKAGLYVFYQTGRDGTAARFELMTPFVLTIPQTAEKVVTVTKEDGEEETSVDIELIYSFEALPKAELIPIPTETTPGTTAETTETVPEATLGIENESGNLMIYAGIALASVAGLMAILMLTSFFTPKKKEDK